ncbi:MAG: hypothetical protein M0P66_08505 [Salinivirgaceae bacterium]|nr:hypothetical protein [Salinivirgaceae bacterium]
MLKLKSVLISLLMMGCHHHQKTYYGVWANNNCELVITEQCLLFYEQDSDTFRSVCMCWDTKGSFPTITAEAVFKDTLIKRDFQEKPSETFNFRNFIKPIKEDALELNLQGRTYCLKLVEPIILTEPYEMFYAMDSTIGSCMQQWMLGSRVVADAPKGLVRCSIGTNQHSFMFDFNNEFTYCRAARIRSNNKGALFSQNFRLWSRGSEHKAFIAAPDFEESSRPLVIDDSLFTPEACYYDPTGIYWSLVRFEKEQIWVNGCGQEYRFDRPCIHQNLLTEWFLFDKY